MRNYFSATCKLVILTLFTVMLGACGGRDELKRGTAVAVKAPAQYDLTVLADKDGQFDFDGATLTAEDLRGHIRYLNEAGQTVHTILLRRGEKEKIKNEHVAALASIGRDLHVTSYVYDNDDHLKIIQVSE